MTVKSLALLEMADVVLYDDLAAPEALERCRKDAERIYVGKRGGKPSMKQPEIDEELVRLTLQGKQVRTVGLPPETCSAGDHLSLQALFVIQHG